MQKAVVTVVVATRNRSGLVARALDSIAMQTFEDFEVFVVDDGSVAEHADAYRATVARYGDRFRLLQPLRPGETGSGPATTRNRGIFAGAGAFVAFLDDDDVWTSERHLETALASLMEQSADFYCADMEAHRDGDAHISSWFAEPHRLGGGIQVMEDPPVYRHRRSALLAAAAGRVIHPNMLVLRRSLVEKAGGFLPTLLFGEDMEFVLRLLDHVDDVLFCPRVVARYRLPDVDSVSTTRNRMAQQLDMLAAARHLRLNARTDDVREQARDIEAWSLRALGEAMKRTGRTRDAVVLALQALAVRPTPGSALHLVRMLSPVVREE